MNPVADLVVRFQELVAQVPELIQPLIVAVAALVPFIEGEGAASIGIVGGIHPAWAALAGIIGNFAIVTLVVLITSRVREGAKARSAQRQAVAVGAPGVPATAADAPGGYAAEPESKGRQRFRMWVNRFGVPGASLLGPLAIPTHFTAAMLVGMGAKRGWVLLWQGIAIVLWTVALTLLITGVTTFVLR
jgi:uncharacterized membrane protein